MATIKGRPSNKNYNKFSILYSEEGDMRDAKKLAEQISKEYKEEEKQYYTYKERSKTLHIPRETAKFISLTKVGGILSDVKCAHCGKTIVMLFSTIRAEQMEICPLCNRNIYDKNDKKINKVWW